MGNEGSFNSRGLTILHIYMFREKRKCLYAVMESLEYKRCTGVEVLLLIA